MATRSDHNDISRNRVRFNSQTHNYTCVEQYIHESTIDDQRESYSEHSYRATIVVRSFICECDVALERYRSSLLLINGQGGNE